MYKYTKVQPAAKRRWCTYRIGEDAVQCAEAAMSPREEASWEEISRNQRQKIIMAAKA